jgi:hypothetical protein
VLTSKESQTNNKEKTKGNNKDRRENPTTKTQDNKEANKATPKNEKLSEERLHTEVLHKKTREIRKLKSKTKTNKIE